MLFRIKCCNYKFIVIISLYLFFFQVMDHRNRREARGRSKKFDWPPRNNISHFILNFHVLQRFCCRKDGSQILSIHGNDAVRPFVCFVWYCLSSGHSQYLVSYLHTDCDRDGSVIRMARSCNCHGKLVW